MKTESFDSINERLFLNSLMVDPTVLAHFTTVTNGKVMLPSPSGKHLGRICIDYFNRHQKPPGYSLMASLLEAWAKTKDETTVDMVGTLINSLQDEFEQAAPANVNHVLDIGKQLCNRVAMESLSKKMTGAIETGKLEDGLTAIEGFRRISIGLGSGSNVFTEKKTRSKALTKERNEALISYPDGLGRFFGSSLRRGAFVSILAPEKTGKTAWLVDMAYRAVTQRVKAAYFSVGDEDEDDINERMLVRACEHPTYSDRGWPLTLRYPMSIDKPLRTKEGKIYTAAVDYEDKTFTEALTLEKANRTMDEIQKKRVRSDDSYFRVASFASLSINVGGITNTIRSWELTGWLPDVVIIDMPDNLEPETSFGRDGRREQIITTWKKLRSLSQAPYYFLVVVATQSDAAGYSKRLLDRNNFSDSKTKLAEVTGMFGLNVYDKEKSLGITRLNWIVRRKGDFTSKRVCHVAGSLALANPAIVSVM
jgi:hypothetical protein